MQQHIKTVANVLNRKQADFVPRGELFIGSDFLGHYYGGNAGFYAKQLRTAAQLLGLSLIGIDLNSERSLSLLSGGGYTDLDEYFTVGYINGPFASLIHKHGFYNAILSTKKNPLLLINIAKNLLENINSIVRRARDNGLNAICVADDIAGNKGLFFSVSYFIEALCPIYNEIAGIIKENCMFAFFHSDGDMIKVIELLIRAQYDCIHPVDTQAGMNLDKLTKAFGQRVSFMGHIDIISWTEKHIKEEIRLAENTFQKGGLILGSTCGISMKTVSDKLGALYPLLEGKEKRP